MAHAFLTMVALLTGLLCVCYNIITAAALARTASTISSAVDHAAGGGVGWTAAQYAAAALLLLDAPHSAVTRAQMEEQLGSHVTDDVSEQRPAGKPVLQALVKAHRLSLRPTSDWALDIPEQAVFRAEDVIVTAASAVDLHAMGALRSKLEYRLKRW
jgi:hypothetical protein